MIACVLAGWRSGVVALVTGQLMALFWVVEPQGEFATDPQPLGAFVFASLAQALILIIIANFQREVAVAKSEQDREIDLQSTALREAGEARAEQDRQMGLRNEALREAGEAKAEHDRQVGVLDMALREIDHRIRNNYQTVLALVRLQAQRSGDPQVRDALNQVADRITAVARVTDRLAQRGEDLETVRLGDHLRDLCDEVERGLSREGIELRCDLVEVSASADKGAAISIILNELLTNALKHAFGDNRAGVIRVDSRMSPAGFELTVADNGQGMKARAEKGSTGLGRKLVETFVRQIGASHEVATSESGTTHRVVVPSLD